MQHVTEVILFAEDSDLCRFKKILDAQIAAGALSATKAYGKFSPPPGPSSEEVLARAKKKLEAAKRKRTAKNKGSAGGGGGEADLFAMIRGRQAGRAEAHDAMLDALAAKHAPAPSRGEGSGSGVRKAGKTKKAK
ncbi:hypothetical protein T492DRAFT_1098028 [Pavlovales sp. CCMP2436]|nr:hypothetical protein T492DRAFT_1098028 [Pavlovales sp. CCMP2436]